jgi:uncharacterized protein
MISRRISLPIGTPASEGCCSNWVRRGPPFSPLATVIYAILVAFLLVWTADTPALSYFDWPGFAVVRVYDRELDLASAGDTDAPDASTLAGFLGKSLAETRSEAATAFEELLTYWGSLPPDEAARVDEQERSHVRAHLVILLAEEGRSEEAHRHLADLDRDDAETRGFASLVRAAYPELGQAALPDRALEAVPLLGWGWAARTVVSRLRARGIEPAVFGLPSDSTTDLPALLQGSARALAAQLTVVLMGLGAGLYLWRERRFGRIANGFTVGPWPAATVAAVLVRALLYGIALSSAVYALAAPESSVDADVLAWLLGPIPFFYLVHRYLVRPQTWRDRFGLSIPPLFAVPLLLMALAIAAAALAGEVAIGLVSRQFGLCVPWTDTLLGPELFATGTEYALLAVSVVVWGPLMEEVCFRGLVYATLRSWLRRWPAALASAALFAVCHPYSSVGLIVVLWSGVLLAIAYERTGSILPGWIAHATMNGLVLLNGLVLR